MRLGETAEQPVLFTGAMRMMVERLDAASFELQREAERNQDANVELKNQEVTHKSRRAFGPNA